jgi:hypothetical protein
VETVVAGHAQGETVVPNGVTNLPATLTQVTLGPRKERGIKGLSLAVVGLVRVPRFMPDYLPPAKAEKHLFLHNDDFEVVGATLGQASLTVVAAMCAALGAHLLASTLLPLRMV